MRQLLRSWNRRSLVLGAVLVTTVIVGAAVNESPVPLLKLAASAKELGLTKGLAVGLIGSYGREAVPSDFLAWQMASGTMAAPREGVAIGTNDRGQEQTWAAVEAGADGFIQNRALSGGTLYVVVDSERPRTMILEATGYYVGWINGEPRGGEKYGADWVRHPVRLVKGRNELMFRGERGRFRGRLYEPPAEIFFTDKDATLPDLVLGEKGPFWAGLRLVNATGERFEKIEILFGSNGRDGRAVLDVSVPPLTTQKLAVPLSIEAPSAEGTVKLEIRARARAGRRTAETPPFIIELNTVAPSAHHARTFVSGIDRSVQYFGVAPMARRETPRPADSKPALVLTLHGAGVEAIGQARAYKSKDWAYVVAATNRRPYGFDWEDWGRLDALEVLAEASRLFGTDPARTYLTGHSMGGHGAWQIGATAPGLWAAIAPSAGWHSFTSYGGGTVYKDPSPVEQMLVRANNPSETTALARNFLHFGVYILHGDQDDNVPVTQARFMRELLGKFHTDFSYYERPGAGHWWGNECVDWPPLFEFLKERARPQDADVRRIEFMTANPGLSSRSRWVEVLAQTHPLEYSSVVVDKDETGKVFKGTTENIARLAFDVPGVADGGPVTVDLDGSKLEVTPASGRGRIYLERGEKGWLPAGPPASGLKGPHRSGGFKDAFRYGFILVYGTRGDAAEDARSFGKARFDAEMFWIRGNAGIEVLPDTAFDPAEYKDRSVILYGNADTNAAWPKLLAGSPVEVRNGWARAGDRRYSGPDFAAYFVRPRPGSDVASVGVVAWTGGAGWVAASPGQYFISGAGFPDLLLFSAETLRSGTDGVRAIGWFGNDWSLDGESVVWNDGRPHDPGAPVKKPRIEAPVAFDPQKTYPAEALQEDLKVLWDMLEEGHGGFDRYTPASVLKKSFDDAMDGLTGPMTEFDFYLRLLPLIAEIKDGHTRAQLSPPAGAFLDARPAFFPFGLRFLNGKAYIFRNLSSAAGIKEGAELLAINGTSMAEIVSELLPLMPSDAGIRTSRVRRLEFPASFGRLFALRFGPRESFRLRFRPFRGKDIRELSVPGVTVEDLNRILLGRYPATTERRPVYEMSFRGTTAVLTIRSFGDDPEKGAPPYPEFLNAAFRTLEEKKTPNLIIDLRGNGGGMDSYGKLLFAYVMDRPFLYYWTLETKKDNYDLFRFTNETAAGRQELARQVRKNARGWFDVIGHPNSGLQNPQKPRFTGRVAILIDGLSFSATGETTSLFHFYKKAVFFGEECGAGYYGNSSGFMVMATLPNTRIQVRIPLVVYTMAVDGYPKDRGIVPDHPVTPTIEDLLAGRDPVMERALLFLDKK
jgi:dienelactone hydrolase